MFCAIVIVNFFHSENLYAYALLQTFAIFVDQFSTQFLLFFISLRACLWQKVSITLAEKTQGHRYALLDIAQCSRETYPFNRISIAQPSLWGRPFTMELSPLFTLLTLKIRSLSMDNGQWFTVWITWNNKPLTINSYDSANKHKHYKKPLH